MMGSSPNNPVFRYSNTPFLFARVWDRIEQLEYGVFSVL
jgi:hypothetical protein